MTPAITPPMVETQLLKDTQEALKIAKVTMMMSKGTTFYTTILFSLKQIISYEVPTAAVDGLRLWINPEFFMAQSPLERIGLLAHEVLHVALDHMHRCGTRNFQWWNIAGDYVINGHLLKANYHLPKERLYNADYVGMTTEAVYDILYKKNEQEKAQILAKWGKLQGDVIYPANQDPKDQVTQDDVTDLILRATIQAKHMDNGPGSIPGEVEIGLERILNPPLPWNVILQHLLQEFTKDDYSFKRPNRRFMPDYYLPTAHSQALSHIALIVDSSCSVSDNEFSVQIGKINEILTQLRPKRTTVVAFDTKIKTVQELKDGDNPFTKLKFTGRGGTQIKPVHQWIHDNKPTAAVIFSDGEFSQTEPISKHIPLFWVIYNDPKWKSKYGGRVIPYEIK